MTIEICNSYCLLTVGSNGLYEFLLILLDYEMMMSTLTIIVINNDL
jgi:hypothetical protein